MYWVTAGLECSRTVIISDTSSQWATKQTNLKCNHWPFEKRQLWNDLLGTIESLWHIFKESSFPVELLLVFMTLLATVWWWVHSFVFLLQCSILNTNLLKTAFNWCSCQLERGKKMPIHILGFLPSSSSQTVGYCFILLTRYLVV